MDQPHIQPIKKNQQKETQNDKERFGRSPRRVVGKIANVVADETVLSDNGKVDPAKLNALIFDQFQSGYYVTGEKVVQAWNAGKPLMQKK